MCVHEGVPRLGQPVQALGLNRRQADAGGGGRRFVRLPGGLGRPALRRLHKDFTGGANEPCVACEEAASGATSFISFLIFGVLIGGVVLSMRSASVKKAALSTAKKLKDVQGLLRIAIGNYQVISMMPTVFKIDYPSGFESVIKVLRVLSLDILKAFSLDCTFNLSY